MDAGASAASAVAAVAVGDGGSCRYPADAVGLGSALGLAPGSECPTPPGTLSKAWNRTDPFSSSGTAGRTPSLQELTGEH